VTVGQTAQDTRTVLAAAVPAAPDHLRAVLPAAGRIAADTSSAEGGGLAGLIAAQLGMERTSLDAIRVCDRQTLRCTFNADTPPAVVWSLQPVGGAPAIQFRGSTATVTLDVYWEHGTAEERRIEGRTVAVQLTRAGGVWRVTSAVTLFQSG
jgi:hypothetical protein